MHILCPKFGYCVKHEKNPMNSLCFKCKYYTILFFFFLLSNSHHNVHKNKDEGIAHNGPIMLWWRLNDNGPKFCNALMIKLGPYWNWNVKKPSPCNSHIILLLIIFYLHKGFNIRALHRLAPPSLKLRLPKSLKNFNTFVVNIWYKWRSMGEWYSYTLNCDYSLCMPTKQYSHHICKHANIALLSSKNALLCCKMSSLAIPKYETFILTPCYITYIH
jgi:hypothetical protein